MLLDLLFLFKMAIIDIITKTSRERYHIVYHCENDTTSKAALSLQLIINTTTQMAVRLISFFSFAYASIVSKDILMHIFMLHFISDNCLIDLVPQFQLWMKCKVFHKSIQRFLKVIMNVILSFQHHCDKICDINEQTCKCSSGQ
jgi:hypothetical protein